MKTIRYHKRVEKDLLELDVFTCSKVAQLLEMVSEGAFLGMPTSRPMSSVAQGVHELRINCESGMYRVFYYTKVKDAILVFHFFQKKTQKTPLFEIETGKRRLGDML